MTRWALILTMLCAAQIAAAQEVRQMLNGFREEAGLGPVTPSPRLEQAAMAHALDMVENGFFDHVGSDGSTIGDRARRVGYRYCALAENIAQGHTTPEDVLGAWIASPPHRKNLSVVDITDYGLVRAQGNVWVLVLGRDGC